MTSDQETPSARDTRAQIAQRMRADVPWIAILCLTSAFQFFRGAPADGAVFVGAALALTLDTFGLLRFARLARTPRTVVAFSVGVILVAFLTFLPRFSFADGVIVVGVGVTLIPFAWSEPAERASADRTPTDRAQSDQAPTDRAQSDRARPDRAQAGARNESPARAIRRAAILWSAMAVTLCLWEIGSFFLGMPSAAAVFAHPALSDLIVPLMNNPIGLAAGAALWLLGGAALLHRGRPR
ncbi:hypothetical protein [Rathayibacter soli]|uniref:hypothetical protein n=1 Tax=Rathayibacter soli TaxID=3144168 RepID=UPI0027E48F58|nr:hypothetical protein [Glaciibacter superstes]